MSYVKLRSFVSWLWSPGTDERGQTLFEVTLIISLVAIVALLVLSALGLAVVDLFDPLADTIDG
jgi:Flp pilus assembly pilin Flp